MASNRTPHILYDIADFINGRACSPTELGDEGLPVIKIAELNNGIGPSTKHLKTLPLDKHRISRGDLLFAWSASVGIYKWSGEPAVLNQHIFNVRAREVVDQGYLRYLLTSLLPTFEGIVADQATTMGHVKVADLKKLAVELPDKDEQAEIASVLGALDGRIENLRATNETLEAIVQALFKSWFVDFDPVKAKAEGKAPVGMNAETAELFPSEFEESELGPIPKGWGVQSLDTFATYLNGLALQKFPAGAESASLPVIKIAQLRAKHTRGADRASRAIKPEYVVKDGDVLFSWSGTLEVDIWCGGEGALNQHLFKVTSSQVPKWYYLMSTKQHLAHFREIAADKATTMGHIQRGHLSEAKCAVPDTLLMAKASETFAPLLDAFVFNAQQSRTLQEVRDELLPKLISGELRLPGFGDNAS